MPAGQSERAMDSARIRCAALAGAKAAVLGIPRRDAVAPMKMILPAPARFMAGIAELRPDASKGVLHGSCVGYIAIFTKTSGIIRYR
jgi:hypothetical protein